MLPFSFHPAASVAPLTCALARWHWQADAAKYKDALAVRPLQHRSLEKVRRCPPCPPTPARSRLAPSPMSVPRPRTKRGWLAPNLTSSSFLRPPCNPAALFSYTAWPDCCLLLFSLHTTPLSRTVNRAAISIFHCIVTNGLEHPSAVTWHPPDHD